MPLVYSHHINPSTKIGVWHITEPEEHFLSKVPLQRDIRHWHKRLQHLAGRILLKELFPDFPVNLIMLADTRRPYLEEEPYHFSISHCGNYAAVLVSRDHRVGVDLEQITERIGSIIPKFLSPSEISQLPAGSEIEWATLCWTVKESIFKWQGGGGVDFKRDINIKKITVDNEGVVECLFKGYPLRVNYLRFNDNFLAWLLENGQAGISSPPPSSKGISPTEAPAIPFTEP